MEPGGFLDPGGPLTGSNHTVFWVFASATFLMVAASAGVALRETFRLRSSLPLVLFASAALWLPNEPFIDVILGFQYAADAPATLYTLLDREIPVSALGIGAMFFLFPWFIHRMLVSGTSMRTIILIALVAGIIDWPLEIMAIQFDVFTYYGDNPSRIFGLPLTSMVQNMFLYLGMAAVFTLAAPHLRGWRSLLFLPVIPGMYYVIALLCTWPYYLALHTQLETLPFLALTGVAAAMNAYIPYAMIKHPAVSAAARQLRDEEQGAVRPPHV